MSVRAFAQEFDINLATFRNWLYKKQVAPATARWKGIHFVASKNN